MTGRRPVAEMVRDPLAWLAVMSRLVAAMQQPPGAGAGAGLAPAARRTAGAAFFLCDRRPGFDVERWLVDEVGRILNAPVRQMETRLQETNGELRGKVHWPATFKARSGGEFNPVGFVCRENHHRYDTPENQTVLLVAGRIRAAIDLLPPALRMGFSHRPDGPPLATQARLDRLEGMLHQLQRSVYWRDVTALTALSPRHFQRSARAKAVAYRHAPALARQWEQLCGAPAIGDGWWPALCLAGRAALPLPGHAGPAQQWLIDLAAAVIRSELARTRQG